MIDIRIYDAIVTRAHSASGDQGFVNLKDLREQLKTPAWASIHDDDSVLCKMLRHKAFKEGMTELTEE